ncbi:helix-turn-helix domain-containing protein [Haloarcula salina]|uniref:Helix-turn-helix domain-containing protein n=1 Tax=Haloarcula salina TaxID=1429914 RepID=A0AA41KIK3_9EURY|nr:helix-turn-helix domain-containing protein [Haloarcula salina]MBV0902981.1 helix-turn-helix domain-containing protein [Haloarcula salina]
MTLIASVRLASPALETSARRTPGSTVRVEQQVPTADGALDLTLWSTADDPLEFECGLDDDGTVDRWTSIGGAGDRALYRVRLTAAASATFRYERWSDGRAVFLSADRGQTGWTVNAYVPDRSVLQQIASGCEDNDVQFELVRVAEVDQLTGMQQYGLSDVQAETLTEALDRGYYTIPREVSLGELAQPLDVSHQAVSERLRRGICSLLENTVAERRTEPGVSEKGGTSIPTTQSGDVSGPTAQESLAGSATVPSWVGPSTSSQ